MASGAEHRHLQGSIGTPDNYIQNVKDLKPPPSPPPPPSETQIAALQAHNERRALHQDTGDLTWDADLAASAQAWADGCAVCAAAAVSAASARTALLMPQGTAPLIRVHRDFGLERQAL